jgi:hypothetical protein
LYKKSASLALSKADREDAVPTLNDTSNKKDAGGDLIENGPREYRDRQGLSSSLGFGFEIDLSSNHFADRTWRAKLISHIRRWPPRTASVLIEYVYDRDS